jgi:polyhydroxyalkanoate synthesis repressor PhaR
LHCNTVTRLIRKYGNRRLYDTSSKRYVNLDEITRMVREGDDIQVVDAKSGEDLTRTILTQIIMDDAKNRDGGLPLEILRELISLSDKARHELLGWYVDFVRNLFNPRTPGGASEVEDLRRRIDELERQLNRRTRGADSGQ